jgi:hypothetical protein
MRRRKVYMRNVSIRTKGNKVAFIVDKTKDFGPSTTGKTHIVASSGGSRFVGDGDLRFSLAVFRKQPRGR